MGRLLKSAFILLIALTVNVTADDSSIAKSFHDCEIVPFVIPKAPISLAKVKYGNAEVELGNKMSPTDLVFPPTVSWDADCNENYTLAMIDPDAPSRANPILSPIQHWLIINIPGSDVAKGETLSPYLPPTPPPGSGYHRYIILVYKQCSPLQLDLLRKVETSIVERVKFSIEDFAEKYNLGKPVAGNFLHAAMKLPVVDSLLGEIY